MILVFGGTTEGRCAVQVLEEAGKPFWYSTLGRGQDLELVNGIRVTGGMNSDEMGDFCRRNAISLIVDAAHPFATELHHNIHTAAQQEHLSVIRYERLYEPHSDDVCWCEDFEEAIARLREQGIRRLLALTGVQTIGGYVATGMTTSAGSVFLKGMHLATWPSGKAFRRIIWSIMDVKAWNP